MDERLQEAYKKLLKVYLGSFSVHKLEDYEQELHPEEFELLQAAGYLHFFLFNDEADRRGRVENIRLAVSLAAKALGMKWHLLPRIGIINYPVIYFKLSYPED